RLDTLALRAGAWLPELGLGFLAPQAVTNQMHKHGTVRPIHFALDSANDSRVAGGTCLLPGCRTGPAFAVGQKEQAAALDLGPDEHPQLIRRPVPAALIGRRVCLAISATRDFKGRIQETTTAGDEQARGNKEPPVFEAAGP